MGATVKGGLVSRAKAPTSILSPASYWSLKVIFLGSGRGQGMTLGPGRSVGWGGGGAGELQRMAVQSLPPLQTLLVGVGAVRPPLGRQMLWPSLCLP